LIKKTSVDASGAKIVFGAEADLAFDGDADGNSEIYLFDLKSGASRRSPTPSGAVAAGGLRSRLVEANKSEIHSFTPRGNPWRSLQRIGT
jgi:Tol biopolymer transport system component